ncbi:MAG: hypothetical protein KAX65_00020 [Caldilineaceae bacterium]|nr:hypothetical protein [Caldilineaceae bacterium]
MCNVTLRLVSPSGVPVTLEIAQDEAQADILADIERADKVAQWCIAHGWGAGGSEAAASGPSAGELASGPTFAGYPCSPTVDAQGLPTWIIFEGKQAQRREKQGDVWYSVRGAGEGDYTQVLRIPKGEKAPAVVGLP